MSYQIGDDDKSGILVHTNHFYIAFMQYYKRSMMINQYYAELSTNKLVFERLNELIPREMEMMRNSIVKRYCRMEYNDYPMEIMDKTKDISSLVGSYIFDGKLEIWTKQGGEFEINRLKNGGTFTFD